MNEGFKDFSADMWAKILDHEWMKKNAMQQKAARRANRNGTTYQEEWRKLKEED